MRASSWMLRLQQILTGQSNPAILSGGARRRTSRPRLARRVPMSALVPFMRPSCTGKRLPKHSQYSTATAVCADTLHFFAVSFRPPRSCGPLHHSLPFAVPAHAGIDRSHASRDSARTGFPRTRGDRPAPRDPAKTRPHRRHAKRRSGPLGSLDPLTSVRTVNCASKVSIRAGPRTCAKKT